MEQPQAVDELLVALEHEEEPVRLNAAIELALRQEVAAIPVLIRSLSHESWVIRHYHAHRALLALGSAAVPPLRASLETAGKGQPCAAYTLYRLAPYHLEPVVSTLSLALRAADLEVRDDAVHVLGEIGEPAKAAASLLNALLQDPDEKALRRAHAARSLSAMGAAGPELLPSLLQVLRSEDWTARFHVSKVLMDMGEVAHAILPDLLALLRDTAAPVGARVDAAQILATMTGMEAQTVPALTTALQDPDWWVRLYAARALADLGPSAAGAVSALAAALQDTELNVRRNAAHALAQIGAAASEATTALIRALERADIAGIAAEALAKIGKPALQAVQQALREESLTAHRLAAYALQRMELPEAGVVLETWERESGEQPCTYSYADFFPPAPQIVLDDPRQQVFETLLQEALARGEGSLVDYRCAYPKYEFLYYMVQQKGCVLHGSNRLDITLMHPIRRSLEAEDGNPLGNINGVYATPDEIWPIFFAIVDRIHHNVWLINGPLSGPDANGTEQKFYHFSINVESLRERTYTQGMVYVLPGDTFENAGGAERASRTPVRPLVKLPVAPEDLPFLDQMRGFDSRRAGWLSPEERFIFLDEVKKYPVRVLPST